jgi:chemotaxis protein histidine kinase CheA
MTNNIEEFQALLAKMHAEFLAEIPERCDNLDELILLLEKDPENRDTFNELYRAVHSLKGSGGTHGLSIITTICHHLENLLTETDSNRDFNSRFANRTLSFVDLLRRVVETSWQDMPNYAAIEAGLEVLRKADLHSRKIGLIAETSPNMVRLYQQALDGLPLQLTSVDNGMDALERLLHEHYDFVIVGREIKELNGVAMMLALRASQVRNQDISAILVSSKPDAVPDLADFSAVILRDRNLADNLYKAVQSLL